MPTCPDSIQSAPLVVRRAVNTKNSKGEPGRVSACPPSSTSFLMTLLSAKKKSEAKAAQTLQVRSISKSSSSFVNGKRRRQKTDPVWRTKMSRSSFKRTPEVVCCGEDCERQRRRTEERGRSVWWCGHSSLFFFLLWLPLLLNVFFRYNMGLINKKTSLSQCEGLSASTFCRRRLAVVLVSSKFCENLKQSTSYVEQGRKYTPAPQSCHLSHELSVRSPASQI